MKQIPLLLLGLLSTTFIFTACDSSSNDPAPMGPLEVQTATDIPADPNVSRNPDGSTPPPNFTFYSLEESKIIDQADSASTQWDIGLAGTTIIVNGGASGPGQGEAQIVTGVFDELTEAPETGYRTDQGAELAIPIGSDNGWYNYTGNSNPPMSVLPIPGRIIVLKTAQGNYAKMEILSYYEGNPDTSTEAFANFPTRPADRHYTFRYAVQTNGTQNF